MKFESVYRKGKKQYEKGHKMIARVMRRINRIVFQCDIPFEAIIDDDVYFCHNAFGVVINPASTIRGGVLPYNTL